MTSATYCDSLEPFECEYDISNILICNSTHSHKTISTKKFFFCWQPFNDCQCHETIHRQNRKTNVLLKSQKSPENGFIFGKKGLDKWKMAGRLQNMQDGSIVERRLRPIYGKNYLYIDYSFMVNPPAECPYFSVKLKRNMVFQTGWIMGTIRRHCRKLKRSLRKVLHCSRHGHWKRLHF